MSSLTELLWETVGPTPPSEERRGADVLREALAKTAALGKFLDEAQATDEPILLIVNDGHRATQTTAALRSLAAVIEPRQQPVRFHALVATGTHRFSVQERSEFAAQTFDGCGLDIEQVAWHDAADAGALTEVGGVRLNRHVATSRFLLPIGSVEPHYFAGVTGAHKTVTIGCLGRGAIERNHAGAMSAASDILRLKGNPVFDGVVDILTTLRAAGKQLFAINEIVCSDALVAAAVGDPLETLDDLLPVVRRLFSICRARPVDMLHLKVPSPLGRNLYQADKALKNNHLAVRDGGGIVLEARCHEGIGPDAFLGLLRRADSYAAARRIVESEGYRLGDHKAVKLWHLMDPSTRGVHVALVSPHVFSEDTLAGAMKVFADVAPALDWLGSVVSGPLERGLVVEDAGVVSVTAAGA